MVEPLIRDQSGRPPRDPLLERATDDSLSAWLPEHEPIPGSPPTQGVLI